MLKKKFFSFQYLSSERLHQINFSVLNVAASFSVIVVMIIVANYYLSLEFSNQYYQDQLKETDEKYADVSQELLNKIAQLEQELLLIEERDKTLWMKGVRIVDQKRFDLWHLGDNTWSYIPIPDSEILNNPNVTRP